MTATIPVLSLFDIDQTQIRLVDQSRCLQDTSSKERRSNEFWHAATEVAGAGRNQTPRPILTYRSLLATIVKEVLTEAGRPVSTSRKCRS